MAEGQLAALLDKRTKLDQSIAQLRVRIVSLKQLIDGEAVTPLLGPNEPSLRLKESLREVLRTSNQPLTLAEVKAAVERLGYRRLDRASLLASVSTTLRRMVESGAVESGTKGGKKTYRVRTD